MGPIAGSATTIAKGPMRQQQRPIWVLMQHLATSYFTSLFQWIISMLERTAILLDWNWHIFQVGFTFPTHRASASATLRVYRDDNTTRIKCHSPGQYNFYLGPLVGHWGDTPLLNFDGKYCIHSLRRVWWPSHSYPSGMSDWLIEPTS